MTIAISWRRDPVLVRLGGRYARGFQRPLPPLLTESDPVHGQDMADCKKSPYAIEVERLIETIAAERKRLRANRLTLSTRTAAEVALLRRARLPS